jgi:hypothetical protein
MDLRLLPKPRNLVPTCLKYRGVPGRGLSHSLGAIVKDVDIP